MADAAAAGGPWVLALDVGTSSARSVLYDSTGASPRDAPVLQLRNQWYTAPDGAMEADAEAILANTIACIDAAVQLARAEGREIAAVATASFWHSVVGVGSDGRPVTPLFGWGDTRAAAAAAALAQRLDPAAVHRRTGCFLDASYPTARLLWLRETHPHIFSRTARWMSFGEYFLQRVSGAPRCSPSMASGTGMLDTWRLAWDEEVLAAVGISLDALTPVDPADEPTAGLAPEFGRRWPELARVPWLPALGDGACASLGSGAVGAALPGLTLGTSAALRVLVESSRPPRSGALWCYRLDARRLVVGRALSNGGNARDAMLAWLRLPDEAEREAALAAIPPDAHGLTVLPLLVGERGPDQPPSPGAVVAGLTLATRPIEVLRAWLEAVALRLAGVAEALEAEFGAPSRVVGGGGAMHASPAWRAIIADVLGRRLDLAATRETAARGAALVALERLGLIADALAVPSPAGESTLPDDARHARYRAARERQRVLAAAVGPLARPVQPVDPPALP